MTTTSNIVVAVAAWQSSHVYSALTLVTNGSNAYQCVASGTSASSGGPTTTGNFIADGTAHWLYLCHVDYTTLVSWASGIVGSLTQPVVGQVLASAAIDCTTTSFTPILALSGHSTSPTNTITLTAFPGFGIKDTFGNANNTNPLYYNAATGIAFLAPASAGVTVNYFDITDANVIIDGLQFNNLDTTSDSTTMLASESGASNFKLRNCIVIGTPQASGAWTVQLGDQSTVTNNLFIDLQALGSGVEFMAESATATSSYANNVHIAINGGIAAGTGAAISFGNTTGTTNVKNSVFLGYAQPVGGGSGAATISNCVTDGQFTTSWPATCLGVTNGGGNVINAIAASIFLNPSSDFRLVGPTGGTLPPTDYVGYWPMDGSLSPGGGTIVGTIPPVFTTGHTGSGSLQIPDTSDYTDRVNLTATLTTAQLNAGFTVSAWVQTSKPTTGNQAFFSIYQVGASGVALGIVFDGGGANQLGFGFAASLNGSNYQYGGTSTANALPASTWYHVAITYSGAGTPLLYENGQLIATSSNFGVSLPSINAIGSSRNDAFGHWFGLIDELRVYTYPLTATQVLALYDFGGVANNPAISVGSVDTTDIPTSTDFAGFSRGAAKWDGGMFEYRVNIAASGINLPPLKCVATAALVSNYLAHATVNLPPLKAVVTLGQSDGNTAAVNLPPLVAHGVFGQADQAHATVNVLTMVCVASEQQNLRASATVNLPPMAFVGAISIAAFGTGTIPTLACVASASQQQNLISLPPLICVASMTSGTTMAGLSSIIFLPLMYMGQNANASCVANFGAMSAVGVAGQQNVATALVTVPTIVSVVKVGNSASGANNIMTFACVASGAMYTIVTGVASIEIIAIPKKAFLLAADGAGSPLLQADDVGPAVNLIPAYIYPNPISLWTVMQSAPPGSYLVANAASGPGTTADINYVNAIIAAQAAGLQVLGYVDTDEATVTLAVAEANILLWGTLYGVTSIFFDRVSGLVGDEPYYTTLANFVHNISGVVGLNVGAIPDVGYMTIGDVVCIFEDTYANYLSYVPPSWAATYSSKIVNLVHDTPDLASMHNAIMLAEANHTGIIYVTDQSEPNPYTGVPPYWVAETTLLAASPVTIAADVAQAVNLGQNVNAHGLASIPPLAVVASSFISDGAQGALNLMTMAAVGSLGQSNPLAAAVNINLVAVGVAWSQFQAAGLAALGSVQAAISMGQSDGAVGLATLSLTCAGAAGQSDNASAAVNIDLAVVANGGPTWLASAAVNLPPLVCVANSINSNGVMAALNINLACVASMASSTNASATVNINLVAAATAIQTFNAAGALNIDMAVVATSVLTTFVQGAASINLVAVGAALNTTDYATATVSLPPLVCVGTALNTTDYANATVNLPPLACVGTAINQINAAQTLVTLPPLACVGTAALYGHLISGGGTIVISDRITAGQTANASATVNFPPLAIAGGAQLFQSPIAYETGDNVIYWPN